MDRRRVYIALILLLVGAAQAQTPVWTDQAEIDLRKLSSALKEIDNPALAAQQIAQFNQAYPGFPPALWMSAQQNLALLSEPPEILPEAEQMLEDWALRVQSRASMPELLPEGWAQLPPEQTHLIAISLSENRLYLYERQANGRLKQLFDHYVTIGKRGYGKQREGDNLTPVGVYFTRAFKADNSLPDLYGAGAFPLDYPNAYDRKLGRTGYGIWLHGVPSVQYSRTPKASEGCVAMSNPALAQLQQLLPNADVPVLLLEDTHWQPPPDATDKLSAAIEAWRKDWESRDIQRYQRHYDADYAPKGGSRAWFARKGRLASSRSWINVSVRDLTIVMAAPQGDDRPIASVRFIQDYKAQGYSSVNRPKQQFWRQDEHGQWKILIEGAA